MLVIVIGFCLAQECKDVEFQKPQNTEVAEMVRSCCELCVRFTRSEKEWEDVRALLEFGCFHLPQMDRMDTDISNVVTDFGTIYCDIAH